MSILSNYGGSCGSCGALNSLPTMSGGGSSKGKRLENLTVAELKDRAKRMNIKGRSKATTKEALIKLIRSKRT